MSHVKHTSLKRPDLGYFGRNEWAILGGKCKDIQHLSNAVLKILKKHNGLYVDADHKSHDEGVPLEIESFTDKIGYHQWESKEEINQYHRRSLFRNGNLVLVNGNHFQAKSQIVIIDPDKEASLNRRLDQLTNVELILIQKDEQGIPEFLKTRLGEKLRSIPFLKMSDHQAISEWIEDHIQIPVLKGLVLVGGKSTRMGKDKAGLDYSGKAQFERVYEMLSNQLTDVYISCNPAQVNRYEKFPVVVDTFDDLGPFGGILSAFREDPDAAWLVTACDLPLLTANGIKQLIDNRKPEMAGTAFKSHHSKWMEPLISIYEPRIYPMMLQLLAQGYSCARKVMINSPVHIIEAHDKNWLTNVNTPEERSQILSKKS